MNLLQYLEGTKQKLVSLSYPENSIAYVLEGISSILAMYDEPIEAAALLDSLFAQYVRNYLTFSSST